MSTPDHRPPQEQAAELEHDIRELLRISDQRLRDGHPADIVGEALADAVGPPAARLYLLVPDDDPRTARAGRPGRGARRGARQVRGDGEVTVPVFAEIAARFEELSLLAGGDESTLDQLERATLLHELAEPYLPAEQEERHAARGRHLATRWAELEAVASAQVEERIQVRMPGEVCTLGGFGRGHARPAGGRRLTVPLSCGPSVFETTVLHYPLCTRCARWMTAARRLSAWTWLLAAVLIAGGLATTLRWGWSATPVYLGFGVAVAGLGLLAVRDHFRTRAHRLPEVLELTGSGWTAASPLALPVDADGDVVIPDRQARRFGPRER